MPIIVLPAEIHKILPLDMKLYKEPTYRKITREGVILRLDIGPYVSIHQATITLLRGNMLYIIIQKVIIILP
jgi:hypothetical protein